MDIQYLAITRDSTILAECAVEGGDYDILVNEILTSTEVKNPRIQFDKAGHRFYILHNEKGLNVIMVSSTFAETEDAFGVLEHVYRSFLISFSSKWFTASQLSLQREFEPQLRQTIYSHSSHIPTPLNYDEDSSAIVMSTFERNLLDDDAISTQIEDSQNNLAIHFKNPQNVKFKMFFSKYKWVFAAIFIFFIVLIILTILLVTTE